MKKDVILIVSEKPSLQQVYKTALPLTKLKDTAEVVFVTLAGHVYQTVLPDEMDPKYKAWRADDLPIVPDNLKYKATPRTMGLLNQVKDALKNNKFDYIVNGCDAGREGESIFFEVYKNLKLKMPIKRIWISAMDTPTVVKGLDNMIEYKNDDYLKNLMYSSFLRQEFDWLFGMNLSRAASIANSAKIPVGRVMTPTLALIVERELQIKNFKEDYYFEVQSTYKEGFSGTYMKDGEKAIEKEEDAKKILSEIKGEKMAKIVHLSNKNALSYAPTLHSLLELQKEANTVLGFTAAKTLELAQVLYEKHKLTTYPRTSSRFLPKSMKDDLYIALTGLKNHDLYKHASSITKADVANLMTNKSYVNDSKVTDHHAITLTKTPYRKGILTKDEEGLYLIIVKRLLSLFLGPEKSIMTDITADIKGYLFYSKNKEVVEEGYKILYPSKDKSMKLVTNGKTLDITKVEVLSKKTSPPKRYTDSSLLTIMANPSKQITEDELKKVLKESDGLGTEATRSSIIENLIKYKMVKRDKKVFVALDYGVDIISTLKSSDIVSPVITAQWEKNLRDVEESKLDKLVFKADMIAFIKSETASLLANKGTFKGFNGFKQKASGGVSAGGGEVIGKCPVCNNDVSDSKHYFCKNYKNGCDFVLSKKILGATITKTEAIKLLSGKTSKVFNFTKKDGKKFSAAIKLNGTKLDFVFNASSKPSSKASTKSKTTLSPTVVSSAKVICKCECKGDIVDKGSVYGCSKCNLSIPKKILDTNITIADIKELLSKKKTSKKKFTSQKTGKPFEAYLILKDGKTEFSFK